MHALIFNVVQAQDAGFSLIVLALTMVILGGFGSWVGAALGAFLLTWIPLHLTAVGVWWPVYYGGATVIVATFVPGGIVGLLRRGAKGAARLRPQRGCLASRIAKISGCRVRRPAHGKASRRSRRNKREIACVG